MNADKSSFSANVSKIVNFFRRTSGSGLLFCTCDNRKLVRAVNTQVIDKAESLSLDIRDIYLSYDNVNNFVSRIREKASKKLDGIIIDNFDEVIRISEGSSVREINFAREILVKLGVPLLFWLSEENMSLFANKAPDLFLRRDRSVIRFSASSNLSVMFKELTGTEAAITEQEKMRGVIPDHILEITLTALQRQRDEIMHNMAILKNAGSAVPQEKSDKRDIWVKGSVYMGASASERTEALHIYRRVMAVVSRHLPLRGMYLEASDPLSDRQQTDLAHIYIGLDTKTRVLITDDNRKTGNDKTLIEETRLVRALEAAAENRHLVILGEPGSGKSTFLRHLALCLSAHYSEPYGGWLERLPEWPRDETYAVPIIAELRNFASLAQEYTEKNSTRSLWDFIIGRLKTQRLDFVTGPLQNALKRGEALILLDGLDEIPSPLRLGFVRDAVTSFTQEYPNNRIIITCRVLSYQDPDLQLPDFPVFELAPFNEEKTDRFIKTWYAELARVGEIKTEGEARRIALILQKAVRRSGLWHLASNPLLLTVMTLVNTHMGRLPEARSMLYDEAADILLRRWDQIKAAGEETSPRLRELLVDADRTYTDLKRVLWRLAFQAHQEGEHGKGDVLADIKERSLTKALADLHPDRNTDWVSQIIDTVKLRSGLLLEREPGIYTFPHRTFQEYFAGAYISTQTDFAKRSSKLAEEGSVWREVILLAAGRLVYLTGDSDKPLELINELCSSKEVCNDIAWRKVWLAGDVLTDIGLSRVRDSNHGKNLLLRVRKKLVRLLESGCLTSAERVAAGNTLAHLGDPRFNPDFWYLPDDEELGFVKISGGKFLTGSDKNQDKNALSNEFPQHKAELSEYWIARYPVTIAQFMAFIQDSGYKTDGIWKRGPDNHPVVNIFWNDAIAYCEWLTTKLRDYGLKITLPSEAEWEYAARGTDGRIFPCGNELKPGMANYIETGIYTTSPVGAFPEDVSFHNIWDMTGNVWEWCQDWFGPYPSSPDRDPKGPDTGSSRVIRGGAWFFDTPGCRSAIRNNSTPDSRFSYLGFRLKKEICILMEV